MLGRQRGKEPGRHPEDHRAGVDQQHAADDAVVPDVPESVSQRLQPRPLATRRWRQRADESRGDAEDGEAGRVDGIAHGEAGAGDQHSGQRGAAKVRQLAAHRSQCRGRRHPPRPDQGGHGGRRGGRAEAGRQADRQGEYVDRPQCRVREQAVGHQQHGKQRLRDPDDGEQLSPVMAVG